MLKRLLVLAYTVTSLLNEPKSDSIDLNTKGYLNKVVLKKEHIVPTIKPLDLLDSHQNEIKGTFTIQIPRTCTERAHLNIGCGAGSALSFIRYLKIY